MSYTLNKTGAQIDTILARAASGGQIDQDIAAEAAARAAADLLKAPLASPALTGTPTAPTAAPGTDTTQLATTAFANAAAAAAAASATSGKADKVAGATAGNLAGLDGSGNLTDAGIAAADVATKDDVQNITPKRTASNDPANSSFSVLCDTAIAGEAKPTLYGKSAVINQRVQNTADSDWTPEVVTVTTDRATNSIELTGTFDSRKYVDIQSSMYAPIVGHAYLIGCNLKIESDCVPLTAIWMKASQNESQTPVISNPTSGVHWIIQQATVAGKLIFGVSTAAENVGGTAHVTLSNLMECDLTAIFTAAELTAIGTSVANLKAAWLKKFGYPLPQYIPYNQGSIVCNNATYQMHGRNVWDEEWRNGYYDGNTGAFVANNSFVANDNPIRVSPSTAYYCNIAAIWQALYYDANGNFLSHSPSNGVPAAITTPDNCAYMNFYVGGTYGGTYKNDICINLSDASFNGTYEAWYDGGSVSADSLNGIGTAVDEQDAEGQIVRRIGSVALGTLAWTGTYSTTDLASLIKKPTSNSEVAVCLCDNPAYTLKSVNTDSGVVGSGDYFFNQSGTLIMRASTTPSGTLYYELATPTTSTTSAANIQTQAGYNSLDPVSGDVQSGDAECEYPVDVIAYIDKKLAEL